MTVSSAWLNARGTCLAFVQLMLCCLYSFCLGKTLCPLPRASSACLYYQFTVCELPSLVCLFLAKWPQSDKRGFWQAGTLWASREQSVQTLVGKRMYFSLGKHLYRWVWNGWEFVKYYLNSLKTLRWYLQLVTMEVSWKATFNVFFFL